MRILLYLLFLGFFSSIATVKAQQSTWSPFYKDNQVEVTYTYMNCKIDNTDVEHEYVVYSVRNLTALKIRFSFQHEVKYADGKCSNCYGENREMHHVISIDANSAKVGGCGPSDEKTLKVFSKFINPASVKVAPMTNFKMKEMVVSPLD